MALYRCGGGGSSSAKLRGWHRNYVESNQNKHSWTYIDGKANVSSVTGSGQNNDPLVECTFLGSSRYRYTARVALWYNNTKYNAGDVVIASSAQSAYYYFAEA